MSIDDVEKKFTLSQLIIMSTVQGLQADHENKNRPGSGGGRVLNKAADPAEQNRKAWNML